MGASGLFLPLEREWRPWQVVLAQMPPMGSGGLGGDPHAAQPWPCGGSPGGPHCPHQTPSNGLTLG